MTKAKRTPTAHAEPDQIKKKVRAKPKVAPIPIEEVPTHKAQAAKIEEPSNVSSPPQPITPVQNKSVPVETVVEKAHAEVNSLLATVKAFYLGNRMLIIGAAIVLAVVVFFLIKGCSNSPQKIVAQNDKTIAPYLQQIDTLQKQMVDIQTKASVDSANLITATNYADAAHLEVMKMQDQLKWAQETAAKYLKQQKTHSDDVHKIINAGPSNQLDSFWQAYKRSKGFKE